MLRKIFFVMAMALSMLSFSFNVVEASVSDTLEEAGEFEFNTGEELYQKVLNNLQEDNSDASSYIVISIPDEKFKKEEAVWMEFESIAKQREELFVNYRSEEDDNHQIVHYFIFQLN